MQNSRSLNPLPPVKGGSGSRWPLVGKEAFLSLPEGLLNLSLDSEEKWFGCQLLDN